MKYRPKTISQLDNSRAAEVISKVLASKSIPHAFLFVGLKGTGKTSTARILAKAVNCLKNSFAGESKSTEPCNECENCISVSSGSSVDVLEMDAASNRGIEEVKTLIRDSAFAPMHNRYKIFIIDEAHMITTEGFNALLKTLEEPPQNTIFILATTNLEKVPKTIVSRCQVVNFGRAKKSEIINMLKRIAKQENIKVSEEFFTVIASHAEASFRDAAKIFEELIVQNKLTAEGAKQALGMFGKTDLLEVIDTKELKDSLSWVAKFADSGGDFKSLIENMLDELRVYLLAKSGVEDAGEAVNFHFTIGEVTTLMKLFSQAYSTLGFAPIESIPLEVAIADFYNSRKK